MAIGKKLRFEILERDGFLCQQCGYGPPRVQLHVDHIKPRAKGGSDDKSNLVTLCEDCNLGKGCSLLSRIPSSGAYTHLVACKESNQAMVNSLLRIYKMAFPGEKFGEDFTEISIMPILSLLPFTLIKKAMELATARYGTYSIRDRNKIEQEAGYYLRNPDEWAYIIAHMLYILETREIPRACVNLLTHDRILSLRKQANYYMRKPIHWGYLTSYMVSNKRCGDVTINLNKMINGYCRSSRKPTKKNANLCLQYFDKLCSDKIEARRGIGQVQHV